MRKKLFTVIVLLLSLSHYCNAQDKKTAMIKGKLLNSATKAPFDDIKVSIPGLNVFTTSDGEGNFEISEVPYGQQTIVISSNNAVGDTISVTVNTEVVDLHDINIKPSDKGIVVENTEIPTITVEDNGNTSSADDGVSAQDGGEVINSSTSPFLRAISGIFYAYNFHYRGFVNNPHEFEVNGISYNDVETNSASTNLTGRLYDVFSNRSTNYGLEPSDYTFGSVNGSVYIHATAADQQQETKISYTLTDRNYTNGVMVTENSGLMKNGWAFSVSVAKRDAKEGYVPGTFYHDYSYYAAASKVIGKGILNLTTFGAPIDHGKAASATQEAYDLAGTNFYNQNWGYDGPVKRNARVEQEFRPITILNYEYKPSDRTRWNTAVGYEFGKDETSLIDGYNVSSPYGDYYKNMPSYFLNTVPPDTAAYAATKQNILANPGILQLNWNRMYQANYTNYQTIYNVNGVPGSSYYGRQSSYVLSNDVNNLKKFTFNTNVTHVVNEHFNLSGGFNFVSQSTETYYQLADLLGGDYYINYNEFASQQYVGNPNFNQNNLNDPNAIIKPGDKYGNDYAIRFNNSLLWGQAVYNYDKFDFFFAANAGDNSFNRDGYYRNGLFPNNSYGVSPTQNFLVYGFKGGVNYKVDSRNFFFINAGYTTTPPTSENTYISAATRDFAVNNPTDQKNESLEAGYTLRTSLLNVRLAGYVTDIKNITEIKRFYDDDPSVRTFVNYVMQGEDTRTHGIEFSAELKISHKFSVSGLASVGQSFYTNNPNISVYLDNDTTQHATASKTYIKNYYVAAGPQSTYILSFNYHPRRDLFVNLSCNYLDRNYVEINPNRRTEAAIDLVQPGSTLYHEIIDQQELPSAFTVDLRAGKKFQLSRMSKTINKVSKNTILEISASIDNLLNNTSIINSGYEQLRYDFEYTNPNYFPNKYIYGMGINYSITASLKF